MGIVGKLERLLEDKVTADARVLEIIFNNLLTARVYHDQKEPLVQVRNIDDNWKV
jgi:hypothetical protein